MTILSTKLKNAFDKLEDSDKYSMSFKNISVNGDKRGCSGFITNLENDVCVYIDTESVTNLGMLYRYAEREGEYTGGNNHFAHSLEEIIKETRRMLENPQNAERELAAWGKHYQGDVPVQRYGKDAPDKFGNKSAKPMEKE